MGQKVNLPEKSVPLVTSNSLPMISVRTIDWDHVSGEELVRQIREGKSLLETLGAPEKVLRQALMRAHETLSEIGGYLLERPAANYLVRIDLDDFEALRDFLTELEKSGIELVPGISEKLHRKLAREKPTAKVGELGLIEMFLERFFYARQTAVEKTETIIIDSLV